MPAQALLIGYEDALELKVLAQQGWQRGTSYRMRLAGVKDKQGRGLAKAETFVWKVAARGTSSDFSKSFAVPYATAKAAMDTLGGRFPGGQNSLFQGLWADPVTGISYARARWYDGRNAGWLSEDPLLDVDSSNIYAALAWLPALMSDPAGTDVQIIVGRPYRKSDGEWAAYGHVAIRIFDSTTAEYDIAYDFGRYGKTWGLYDGQGEGILNIQDGKEYLVRESRERSSVAYLIVTNPEVDRKIIDSFESQISEGESRPDIQSRLKYRHNRTFQLKQEYDAAVLSGIGRNTCATKTAEACKASGLPGLSDIIYDAVNQLRPYEIEIDLEKIFRSRSPIIKARTLYLRNYSITVDRLDQLRKSDAVLMMEEWGREAMWQNPDENQ